MAALARCLPTIEAINRQIESIRARRARTIASVIRRRASCLRLTIVQAQGYKAGSKADWAHMRSEL
jgi:hypothetical protein